MLGNHFTVSFRIDGTLAANKVISFKLPFNASLVAVSAGATNDSDATLMLGSSSDTDAYMTAKTIGDSGAPTERTAADFINAVAPHITKGTVFVATLDYDGSAGTAAQNVDIVFTFSEG